jgi:hypothetical protein
MIYPKKVARDAAETAYVKAIARIKALRKLDEKEAIELLLQLTKERMPDIYRKEVDFQPHPASWLNDGRYFDEIAQNADRPENRRFVR